MFSLRTMSVRLSRASRSAVHARQFSLLRPTSTSLLSTARRSYPSAFAHTPLSRRTLTSQAFESLISDLQEQYATAKDEFEMATEETDKNTSYAEADREAARQELDTLKTMYDAALKSNAGEEGEGRLRGSIGARIRELEGAVVALEEKVAMGDH